MFWRLATLPFTSTIASTELNFRVRNEIGCDLSDKSPEHNLQHIIYHVHIPYNANKNSASHILKQETFDELVHLGSTHYCAYTWCLST